MKNIITIVALIIFSTINGQITKPLENSGGVEENVYYKDFNNVLNEFEGTYEYNGSDFYFKLVLQKKSTRLIITLKIQVNLLNIKQVILYLK